MIDLRLGDCLEVMKTISDETIDLVLTSPPYDNLRTYTGETQWNFDVFKDVANELFRIVKKGGVIVWVVGDATIKGSETGTSFRQALYFKEIGLNLHDTMIWKKLNPVPLTHNRYEQSFEYMFVLSKGKPKTFKPIMVDCKSFGLKHNRAQENQVDKKQSVRKREEITIVKKTKQHHNIFSYPIGVGDKTGHPAPFPEQLAKDHIISWSNEGDTVLDPFMGSGTTGKMAKLLNRNFIGIEISEEYYNIAKARIENTNNRISLDLGE